MARSNKARADNAELDRWDWSSVVVVALGVVVLLLLTFELWVSH